MNFWIFKLDLEKAEKPKIKLPTSVGSSKKQESSRKTSISAFFFNLFSFWYPVNANVGMLDVVLKFLNLFSFYNPCFSICCSNWVISSILSSKLFMYFSVSLKLLLISSSVPVHFSYCILQL